MPYGQIHSFFCNILLLPYQKTKQLFIQVVKRILFLYSKANEENEEMIKLNKRIVILPMVIQKEL